MSMMIFNQYMFRFDKHLEVVLNLIKDIPEGHAPWIAFQNRLLGPYLVHGIGSFGFSPKESLYFFYFFLITFQNFLLYTLLKSYCGTKTNAFFGVLVFSLLLLGLQDTDWYYPWDSLEAIIFTLFTYAILTDQPCKFFVFIFCVALLNRESAVFIGLYLFFSGIKLKNSRLFFQITSINRFSGGFILIIFAMLSTKLIRAVLFKSQPNGNLDSEHVLVGNHIHLSDNLYSIFFGNLSTAPWHNMYFANSLWLMLSLIGCASIARVINSSIHYRLLTLYFVILISICIFGVINETRMYVSSFVIVTFFIVALLKSAPIDAAYESSH
jgi:hypothetical protein